VRLTRLLLRCGLVVGPLFTLVYLVEGATRAGYNPRRHPVSSLAIGELGWIQVVNFFASGLLTVLLALGLRRAQRRSGGTTWGPRLIAVCGIGLIGAGLFRTDPLNGYPPGTPDRQRPPGTRAVLHNVFSACVFIGLPAACLVFAQAFEKHGEHAWAIYSRVSCCAFIAAFVATSIGFGGAPGLVEFGGLFQRITLIIGFGWLSALAAQILRKQQPHA
jgi:hypothetical protein